MSQQTAKFPNAKILIAEDNKFSREIITRMFKIFDINPILVEDGAEAIEKIKSNSFDLVILDVHMPKKNAFEVIEEIRALPMNQPIFVALSATLMQEEEKRIQLAGFKEFMKKPLEIESVEELLKKHCSHLIKNT